jgi:cytochrome c peroxidase
VVTTKYDVKRGRGTEFELRQFDSRKGDSRRTKHCAPFAAAIVSAALIAPLHGQAVNNGNPAAPPKSMRLEDLGSWADPPYFPTRFRQAMRAPLPKRIFADRDLPAVLEQLSFASSASGTMAAFHPAGATKTSENAFFQSLGTNGRTCFTCHQPAYGMSISVEHVNDVFRHTSGRDPLFAPVDGATCPKNVPESATSKSLLGGVTGHGKGALKDAYKTLLERGLIRIFLPIPVDADYTIEVVSDPYGCNTDPATNTEINLQGVPQQVISVYRRPRMAASMLFAVSAGSTVAPQTGLNSGNIMWDGREPFLESQAIDATKVHAQARTSLTTAQQKQIVDFETGIFTAQSRTPDAGDLSEFYAQGGPVALASQTPGQRSAIPFTLYTTWLTPPKRFDRAAFRESVARGEVIFSTRTFVISNVAGLNSIPPGEPQDLPGSCAACHSQHFDGSQSFASSQQDQGIGGDSSAFNGPQPSPFLPIFRLTCKAGSNAGFHGASVTTNDPGKALISGKCADVGKFTVPQLRGLAARAPYFSDGSAATLLDVVNFYDKRFSINLSPSEKVDLVNFLNSL